MPLMICPRPRHAAGAGRRTTKTALRQARRGTARGPMRKKTVRHRTHAVSTPRARKKTARPHPRAIGAVRAPKTMVRLRPHAIGAVRARGTMVLLRPRAIGTIRVPRMRVRPLRRVIVAVQAPRTMVLRPHAISVVRANRKMVHRRLAETRAVQAPEKTARRLRRGIGVVPVPRKTARLRPRGIRAVLMLKKMGRRPRVITAALTPRMTARPEARRPSRETVPSRPVIAGPGRRPMRSRAVPATARRMRVGVHRVTKAMRLARNPMIVVRVLGVRKTGRHKMAEGAKPRARMPGAVRMTALMARPMTTTARLLRAPDIDPKAKAVRITTMVRPRTGPRVRMSKANAIGVRPGPRRTRRAPNHRKEIRTRIVPKSPCVLVCLWCGLSGC